MAGRDALKAEAGELRKEAASVRDAAGAKKLVTASRSWTSPCRSLPLKLLGITRVTGCSALPEASTFSSMFSF